MQPYFFPYIGYFQLIDAVDRFIVYDEIKYTKKGWINRNRMLLNGRDAVFSLPLRHANDARHVRDRELAADFSPNKLLNKITGAYRQAPFFEETFPLVEQIVHWEERNLFGFLCHSIVATCQHLGITTEITPSSEVTIDSSLTSQNRVLAICDAVRASVYINAIGGVEMYSRVEFASRGILLKFIRSGPFEYPQFGGEFVASLSIIDVLMFNSLESTQSCIQTNYDLI